jgi:hypothetical protein
MRKLNRKLNEPEVWGIESYMAPEISKALKDYRASCIPKLRPDIPELADKESFMKTLNEMIFAFDKYDRFRYDENVDFKRINNGIILFSKLFQYL